MIKLDNEIGDDKHFIKCVESIAQGIAKSYEPDDLLVVKIDNWFGPKWLGFSGKILGAIGTWPKKLTVPPFVTNRVVWEHCFQSPTYTQVSHDPVLHIDATSEQASQRRIAKVAPEKAVLWFSGQSQENSRGAIMSYLPMPENYWTWYTGWNCEKVCTNTVLRGISSSELSSLLIN